MFKAILAGVLLCTFAMVPAYGQCPDYPATPADFTSVYQGKLTWFHRGNDNRYVYLKGAECGCWDYAMGRYYPYDGKRYGAYRLTPPITPPEAPPVANLGVNPEKRHTSPAYSHNGKSVSKADVTKAIDFPDNSGKRVITVIGSEEEQEAASKAIGTPPPWAVVNYYSPDHYHVAQQGFDTRSGMYIQERDGTVIHRQTGFDGIPTALFRADPSYNPALDPDLRKSSFAGIPLWAIAGALALAGYVLVSSWLPGYRARRAAAEAERVALAGMLQEYLKKGKA